MLSVIDGSVAKVDDAQSEENKGRRFSLASNNKEGGGRRLSLLNMIGGQGNSSSNNSPSVAKKRSSIFSAFTNSSDNPPHHDRKASHSSQDEGKQATGLFKRMSINYHSRTSDYSHSSESPKRSEITEEEEGHAVPLVRKTSRRGNNQAARDFSFNKPPPSLTESEEPTDQIETPKEVSLMKKTSFRGSSRVRSPENSIQTSELPPSSLVSENAIEVKSLPQNESILKKNRLVEVSAGHSGSNSSNANLQESLPRADSSKKKNGSSDKLAKGAPSLFKFIVQGGSVENIDGEERNYELKPKVGNNGSSHNLEPKSAGSGNNGSVNDLKEPPSPKNKRGILSRVMSFKK